VFMNVQATQAQIEAATAEVAAEPGLTVTRVLSKDDAYAEFQRIFASKPKLRNAVRPADLPVSIRVRVSGTVPDDVLDRLQALPGVSDVATPGGFCDPIRDLLDRGFTPKQLARLVLARVAGLSA
jgi:cell division protein FtsX